MIKKLKIADVDLAKLACQQHYESRLLGSLEEVDVVERVSASCVNEMQSADDYGLDDSQYDSGRYDFAQQLLQLIEGEKG